MGGWVERMVGCSCSSRRKGGKIRDTVSPLHVNVTEQKVVRMFWFCLRSRERDFVYESVLRPLFAGMKTFCIIDCSWAATRAAHRLKDEEAGFRPCVGRFRKCAFKYGTMYVVCCRGVEWSKLLHAALNQPLTSDRSSPTQRC